MMIKKLAKNNGRWLLLILSISIALILLFSGAITKFISFLGDFGIIGIFISGLFFGYAFTVAPATASLIEFTNFFNPIVISFVGAIGTMIGDLVLFNLFKTKLPKEIEDLVKKTRLEKLKKSKLKWLIPGIAGFLIASPLPDEIGISLLGASKFKASSFMILAFILNFIGLLIITTIAWLV